MHFFYIIYARKIYVRTGVRITRQWKSTLRRAGYDDSVNGKHPWSLALVQLNIQLRFFSLVQLNYVSNRFFPT